MNQEENVSAPSHEQEVFLIINRQMIPLEKKVTRIGRQLDNDIVLHEEFVSRFHAEIRHEDGKFVLYDNKSTSGKCKNLVLILYETRTSQHRDYSSNMCCRDGKKH